MHPKKKKNGVRYRRARACPSPSFAHSNDRGGQAPALRERKGFLCEKRPPFRVGRGPVPRHAAVYRKLAGETLSDARVASEGPRATGTLKPEVSPTEYIEI